MNTPIGEDVKAEDLGAVTPLRQFRTPFRFAYSKVLRELLAPGLGRKEHTSWDKRDYTPFLNEEPAFTADFLLSIVEGYEAMQQCRLSNQV